MRAVLRTNIFMNFFFSKSNRCCERWASAEAFPWRRWGRKPPRCRAPKALSASRGCRWPPALLGRSSSSRHRSRQWPELPGNHWLNIGSNPLFSVRRCQSTYLGIGRLTDSALLLHYQASPRQFDCRCPLSVSCSTQCRRLNSAKTEVHLKFILLHRESLVSRFRKPIQDPIL